MLPARSTSSTSHQQRIFSWSRAEGLNIVRSDPLDPVNLAVDKSGHLLVVSSSGPEGTVYSFRPGSPADEITVLEPQARAPHAGAAVALPVNVWDNGEFANQLDLDTYEYTTLAQMFARDMTTPRAKEYVSPDGSLFLPAGTRLPAGSRRLLSGDGSDGLALVQQPGRLRLRHRPCPASTSTSPARSEDRTYRRDGQGGRHAR